MEDMEDIKHHVKKIREKLQNDAKEQKRATIDIQTGLVEIGEALGDIEDKVSENSGLIHHVNSTRTTELGDIISENGRSFRSLKDKIEDLSQLCSSIFQRQEKIISSLESLSTQTRLAQKDLSCSIEKNKIKLNSIGKKVFHIDSSFVDIQTTLSLIQTSLSSVQESLGKLPTVKNLSENLDNISKNLSVLVQEEMKEGLRGISSILETFFEDGSETSVLSTIQKWWDLTDADNDPCEHSLADIL